uniref:EamA family transporter n=1 Tax=Anaerolinea thermolimosa TaxID=229919 RepID=A0A7C4PI25_9CHLR
MAAQQPGLADNYVEPPAGGSRPCGRERGNARQRFLRCRALVSEGHVVRRLVVGCLQRARCRAVPASVANLIATLEPALTAVQAYLFLGERMTPTQFVGSFLILSGVVVLRWSEQRTTARKILPSGIAPS